MSKTERTAETVWRVSFRAARGENPTIEWEENLEAVKVSCRAVAHWHRRALARARREGEKRNQVSRVGNMLTKERKV